MDLREQINNIKIIDHHCHPIDYFYWDEAVGAYPFAALVAKLAVPNPMTTEVREKTLIKAFHDLYDFKYPKVTPENEKELDAAYQQSKKDEYKMYDKVMQLAGIESAIEVCMGRPVLPPGIDAKRFGRAQCIDGFMIPLDNSGIGFNDRQKMFVKMIEFWPNIISKKALPKSFDEYLKMISDTFESLAQGGLNAFKMNHAYWRDIAVDAVSKEEAKDVYDKKDNSPVRYKRLQDYIMRFMIAKAGALDLPTHIHTGCAPGLPQGMVNADPSHLDSFLWLPDIMNSKIVLLHGSYPFTHEGGFMASRVGPVPKVYLDISVIFWWHPGSPQSLVPVLREWLDMGCADKMLYGSDAIDPLSMWMGAYNIREALYLTLKEMISEGVLSEAKALNIAQMILRENAKKLYKGKV